jgi:mono/diheme cytochrome c family protein
VLNHHAKRVDCAVCHVPTFAREEATDMARDWSKTVYNAEADKYTATITLQKNVKPVYAWFNGFTRAQLPGEPVSRLADGSVGIMVPQGSRDDPTSRIFAFKLHRAKLPLLAGKNWIIPVAVEQFFPNGKIDPAVKNAAKEMYGIDDARYSWTDASRYMGIFHGVQPASKAVSCLECHSPNGRMDWKALGYAGDPLSVLIESRERK